MKILFAASEAAPLIKTGGLADVAGSLPVALRTIDLDVQLVIPAYRDATNHLESVIEEVGQLHIQPGDQVVKLLRSRLKPHGLPVILVSQPDYFDRPGNPYLGPDGHDWPDNGERFALFCRAVAAIAMGRAGLDWTPDIVHCNDWQTGLVPALLADEPDRPKTLFTIHNLAYQGIFTKDVFERVGLPWSLWTMDTLEFHGNFSFMKGGIAFADHINTVSPTYAREILTAHGGQGMEGALQAKADRLSGILNGIDYRVWDPGDDPHIPQHYDASTFALKARNKSALQKKLGLEQNPKAMLFGHIGRMVYQKGLDLITDILPDLMDQPDTQLVILGSGLRELERDVQQAAVDHRGRMGVKTGYDEPLSHLIEAGCDAFLMPSRFEPCGLNQMYSLRYGTVPIVHSVGGLADSVVDASPAAMLNGTASGFVFDAPDQASFWEAVNRALHFYRRPGIWWEKLATNGMRQDLSWTHSAQQYLDTYRQTLSD